MPALVQIYKAANPDQTGWRARIAHNEKPLIAAFRAWAAELRTQITGDALAQAILVRAANAFDHVIEAIAFDPVAQLEPVAVEEALREFRTVVRGVGAAVHLSFDLRDPNFQRQVDAQGARLVREVTDETRRAINNVISRAYRDGLHPYSVAPELRNLIGLTSRQSQAVMNFRAGMVANGVKPGLVEARTQRYADKLLTGRAKMIGRTETARASVEARMASYAQAAAKGLFDPATASLVWASVQDDPKEICYQLNGESVSYEDGFPLGLPPIHPACRCSVHLEIGTRPRLSLVS